MKFLIIEGFLHHKNNAALNKMLDFLNYEYKLGTIEDISDYDVIYMPSTIIDISKYKDKKFIFGPHLSVFPTEQLLGINNIYKNGVYIQPSDWSAEVWRNFGVEELIPIKILPFSVDVELFSPKNVEKDIIMVYTKRRSPHELNYIINYLNKNEMKYIIFDYVKGYKEEDYIRTLTRAKFGIIVDAHESQGFAIEEALSCNVPLFVWNVKFMSQEYMSKYKDIPCTTIPYWDETCGEYFYDHVNFENNFVRFLNNIEENKYEPRKFILNNLSVLKCAYKLKEIIESI
jgi:hypothetical protein